MKCARWSTLTESTWSTPVRSSVRLKVRMVGGVCRGSRNPWAASAILRAWARESVSVTPRTQPRAADRPCRRLREIQQLLLHGVHHSLHPRVQLELLEDVADVVLDGVLGDEQVAGDLPVVHPLGHQPEHLQLA